MCGIAGVYFKEGEERELERAVGRMNACQAKRGPDDEGVFVSTPVAFGHRRLSIIDLSPDGHQPMERGDLVITFNGEIYNFAELKKGLEAQGVRFKTHSDTEVILALFEKYGPASFARLRGMFAFGLYDKKSGALHLVRDQYGIKPLYFASSGRRLIFASTVEAIRGSGFVTLTENRDAKIAFLLFGSVPLPLTTYREVRAVRAGHYVVWDGREAKEVRYYDSLAPFTNKRKVSFSEAKQEVRRLLQEAVRLNLVSDAPLGVFLSGGTDSSVLSILAAKIRRFDLHGRSNLRTLSIVFDEPEFSEQKYQKLVAKRIKSDHREEKITKEDFLAKYDDVFDAMDQPTVDGVNVYFVAQAARAAGLKTVLSGLGSDEIFCGYQNFRRAKAMRLVQMVPLLPGLLAAIVPKPAAKRLRYLRKKHPLYFYLALRGLFLPEEIARTLNVPESEVWEVLKKIEALIPPEAARLHPVDLLSYLEVNFYMSNQLLKDADFMSMRHSLEVRVPYLDPPLVEYLNSLSPALKTSGQPKRLLIEALGADLPREVWDRPKMGFTFPFQKWLEVKPAVGHWSRFWANVVLNKWNKK